MKVIIDIFGALFLLILLFPLMVAISILVKATSKGPVIFTQKRLTKKGKEFKMFKFRTMIDNAEKIGTGIFSYEKDPRITRFGRFLRKTSLDELPQLFNVLFLKMSFVGPRPPVYYELGEYDKLSPEYKIRFTVRAGITGLAQVSGRNINEWKDKIKYDNIYIGKFYKWGILFDLLILFKTLGKVFVSDNINETEPEYLSGLSDEEKKEFMMNKIIKESREKSGK